MNISIKHTGGVKSIGFRERPYKHHKNKHHRIPRSAGGGAGEGNLVTVPYHHHVAYHKLFHAYGPLAVVRQLNEHWLPLATIAVCIPTARITEALALLTDAGILPVVPYIEQGITENHLRFHGTLLQQEERAPWWTKQKRPV